MNRVQKNGVCFWLLNIVFERRTSNVERRISKEKTKDKLTKTNH